MLFVDYSNNDLFKLRLINNKFVPDEEADVHGGTEKNEDHDDFEENDGKDGIPLMNKKEYSSVMRIPPENGLTGISIREKRVITLQSYDKHTDFSVEIDNNIDISVVKSMMIGPLFNEAGKLKGVIQLLNKLDDKQITDHEVNEFSQLLPTIA